MVGVAADPVARAADERHAAGRCQCSCATAPQPLVSARLTIDGLLAELEIEQYRSAFASAGIGDEQLEIAKGDEEAVNNLIKAVKLRGGSATKVKRRLLAKPETQQPALNAEAGRQSSKRRVKKETHASTEGDAASTSVAKSPPKQEQGLFVLTTPADLDQIFQLQRRRPPQHAAGLGAACGLRRWWRCYCWWCYF